MSASQKLKTERRFLGEMHGMLEVMKQVAASELKHLEAWLRPEEAAPLVISESQLPSRSGALGEFSGLFQLLKAARPDSLLIKRAGATAGVVCFTSDSGFVGDLNSRVIRQALSVLPSGERACFVIGSQGGRILTEQGTSHKGFPGIRDPKTMEGLSVVREALLNWTFAEPNGSLTLIYPRYRSIVRQDLVQILILPIEETRTPLSPTMTRDVLLEGPVKQIEQKAAFWWIGTLLKEAAWHAKLCELAARVNHLEGSVDELGRQQRQMTFQYFHALHEEMDTAVREVYASRRILGGGPLR
ncbi:MAG: F0F1 ATP synthase subunit gamma [Candidatus Omnitrophica bacterium]|nr:F0F1 ATP synthase subunit gamma [Candidatus Omnitrophota bacterium]